MKSFNSLIVENVVQGLGGDDVIAPGDESQNAFAVGFCGRLLGVQLLQETLVPFLDGRNKNNETLVGVRLENPALPDVVDQGRAFTGAHGRINDVEREWFQIISCMVRWFVNRHSNSNPPHLLKETAIKFIYMFGSKSADKLICDPLKKIKINYICSVLL